MTKVSVLLEEFDYVVYDGTRHDLFYDTEEDTFADINGDNIQSCLEYYADLQCIAIYEFGNTIYEDLEDHPSLREHIIKNKIFTGVVMAPLNNDKINYDQIDDIREAFKMLGQDTGSAYALKLDQDDEKTILTMYCRGT